jgi:hypothetical protein
MLDTRQELRGNRRSPDELTRGREGHAGHLGVDREGQGDSGRSRPAALSPENNLSSGKTVVRGTGASLSQVVGFCRVVGFGGGLGK